MNLWNTLLFDPLHVAIGASLLFAAASLVAIFLLFLRRRTDERRQLKEANADRYLSRQLLNLRQPVERDAIESLAAAGQARLERILSRLLQLVRGDDRVSLLAIADTMGIPDAALCRLKHRGATRRIDAMHILESFPSDRVVAAIRARMSEDPDPTVRTEAAATLVRLDMPPRPAAVIAALDLMRQPLNPLHAAIFRAAAPTCGAEIVAIAQNLVPGLLRSRLIEALGWTNDFTVLPPLARFAEDQDPEARIAALKAARQLGHPAVRDWVVPLLLDPADTVRAQAARTCGQLGLTDAIPILSNLVENSSWWVRTRAAEALTRLRPGQPAPFAVTGLRK